MPEEQHVPHGASKAWGLTHNPSSLSEITLSHLAQVLLAAFWFFFFHSPSPTGGDLELTEVNLHNQEG